MLGTQSVIPVLLQVPRINDVRRHTKRAKTCAAKLSVYQVPGNVYGRVFQTKTFRSCLVQYGANLGNLRQTCCRSRGKSLAKVLFPDVARCQYLGAYNTPYALRRDGHYYFFFFLNTYTSASGQAWSHVSSLLPPGSRLHQFNFYRA